MSRIVVITVLATPIFLVAVAMSTLSGARPACDTDPGQGALGTVCGFENPADVESVPAAGVLLVSERRRPEPPTGGAIAAVTVSKSGQPSHPRRIWPTGEKSDIGVGPGKPAIGDPDCKEPPVTSEFSPHGLTSRKRSRGVVRVAVIAHGKREAVELFDLTGWGEKARLSWRGCVRLPANTFANDVGITANHELVVANDVAVAPGLSGIYYKLTKAFGSRAGHVSAWAPGEGWKTLRGSVGPTANGVLLSRDGRTVYYTEHGTGEVKSIGRKNRLAKRDRVNVGGSPDNLSWSARGDILVVTRLNPVASALCRLGNLPCRSDWSFVELDPENFSINKRLRHDGEVVGEVTSVAEFNGRYFFGSAYDDRIGIWSPPIKSAKTR